MAYYDIYDSNDNLIASDVWIDDGADGGSGRPIVINWRKVFFVACAFIGFVSTFIVPVLLFLNRDAFIEGGWIFAAIPNLVIGIPLLAVFASMLSAITKTKNTDNTDKIMQAAKEYVSSHGVSLPLVDFNSDNVSDEEYIAMHEEKFKYESAVARVYLAIRFEKLLGALSKLSYLIYPLLVLCIASEMLYGATESYMILVFTLNYLALFLGVLSVYKSYKLYKRRYKGSVIKRMVCVAIGTYLLGMSVGLVLLSAIGSGGYCALVLCIALLDAVMWLDAAFIIRNARMGMTKIHVWAIVAVVIIMGLGATLVACAISIMPGPVCEAILAYDNGVSTDLSLPITVWSICGAVDVVLTVLISITVNKLLNKKKNKNIK